MPKNLPPECEVLIKAYSKDGLSHRAIKAKLHLSGFDISQSTISRVLKNHGIRRSAVSLGLEIPPYKRSPWVRTTPLIRKVRDVVNKENPPSQRKMAKLFGVSHATMRRMIQTDIHQVDVEVPINIPDIDARKERMMKSAAHQYRRYCLICCAKKKEPDADQKRELSKKGEKIKDKTVESVFSFDERKDDDDKLSLGHDEFFNFVLRRCGLEPTDQRLSELSQLKCSLSKIFLCPDCFHHLHELKQLIVELKKVDLTITQMLGSLKGKAGLNVDKNMDSALRSGVDSKENEYAAFIRSVLQDGPKYKVEGFDQDEESAETFGHLNTTSGDGYAEPMPDVDEDPLGTVGDFSSTRIEKMEPDGDADEDDIETTEAFQIIPDSWYTNTHDREVDEAEIEADPSTSISDRLDFNVDLLPFVEKESSNIPAEMSNRSPSDKSNSNIVQTRGMIRKAQLDAYWSNRKRSKIRRGKRKVARSRVAVVAESEEESEEESAYAEQYPCSCCDKIFDTLESLNSHNNRLYRGKASSKTGKTPKAADAKMRKVRTCEIRIHCNEKPFTCKVCNKAFTQNSTLKSHLKTHKSDGDGTSNPNLQDQQRNRKAGAEHNEKKKEKSQGYESAEKSSANPS